MPRPNRTMYAALLLLPLLAACAQSPQTITLPPRIEPQRLAADLVKPCPSAGEPADMTPHATATWIPLIRAERDCATYKLEQIGKQVETVQ